jgi:hypothetical protein
VFSFWIIEGRGERKMATANSMGNLIVFTAAGDTARVGVKLKLSGVFCVSNSLTGAPAVRLRNGASALDILPLTIATSGAGMFASIGFVPALEVVGLKATNCTNANICVQLE